MPETQCARDTARPERVNDVGCAREKAAEFIVPFAAKIGLRREKSMLAGPFRLIERLGRRLSGPLEHP
jgi:hypothetical protein